MTNGNGLRSEDALSPITRQLHVSLIRLAKGMISAWETWVRAHDPPPQQDPDPVKHFRDVR